MLLVDLEVTLLLEEHEFFFILIQKARAIKFKKNFRIGKFSY